jgi:hypothetical protein
MHYINPFKLKDEHLSAYGVRGHKNEVKNEKHVDWFMW